MVGSFSKIIVKSNKARFLLSVSVCMNHTKWEKSETNMSKTLRSDNKVTLKDPFSIWKDLYLISASLELLKNFAIESSGFDKVICP